MTLPPLPEPDTHCFDDDVGKDVWSHSPEQLHAYGEACAAAERERCARVAEQQAECNGLAAGWHIAAEIRGPDEADLVCDVPPFGWRCTRAKGHDGPCAAVECPEDVAFVERGMQRLRDRA